MARLNKKWKAFAALLLTGLAAPAQAGSAPSVREEVKECLDRWLPPNTKEADQKWFDPELRCETNRAVPKLDERRCEHIVGKLQTLSGELNEMVTKACKAYIPELVADGCELDSKDPHCIRKQNELLLRASENSQAFDQALNKYVEQLKKLRKISLEGAAKVYDATAYSERRDQAMDAANRYFQNLTGDATVEAFSNRNQRQASGPLKEILGDFERRAPSDISAAELGTAAGQSIIQRRADGLDKAWRTVEQKVASPMAYEQLVNTLDAEETHLKMMQYKSDLARTMTQLKSMRTTNEKTLKNLEVMGKADTLPAASGGKAAGSPEGGNAFAAPFASTGQNEDAAAPRRAETASAGPSPTTMPFSFTPVRVRGAERSAARAGVEMPGAAAKTAAAGDAKGNQSGSSSYSASLRNAVRGKLAQNGYATDEKGRAGASEGHDLPVTMDKTAAGARRAESGRGLASVHAEANPFGEMEGALSQGGFSLKGGEHNDLVSGLLSSFESAESEQNAPDYIGALESSPLFERVKIYHDRCLREGRVGVKESL